jgi:carboxypeptidase family protein
MSDAARKGLLRFPAAAARAAAALLISALLCAGAAAGQSTTPQRRTATGPTGKLAGQVIGVDGKPAPKASVYCQSSDGRSPRATKTDEQGRYRLTCPSGPVDARATFGESSSAWVRNVRVRTGETTSLNLHIEATPASDKAKKEKPDPTR